MSDPSDSQTDKFDGEAFTSPLNPLSVYREGTLKSFATFIYYQMRRKLG
jgi:hypothetical protein